MKKIYIVSLEDDVPLSEAVIDKVKVMAYLVYDEIRGLEYGSYSKILDTDNILYNELLERKVGNEYVHRFMYNDSEIGKYEPFMIDNASFGFTVIDGKLNENELKMIIDRSKFVAGINSRFNIDSITYEDDKKNKNRLVALKKIIQKKNDVKKNDTKKVKVKIRTLFVPAS